MKFWHSLLFSFIIIFSATLCPCTGADNFDDRSDITSSLNPVGSGARALGMGGAFIAIADDATAASWNPGGLIQLEHPEISFVTDSFHRIEDSSSGKYSEISGDQTVSKARLNYFSAALPFKYMGRHMIVSVNYQNLYDFIRKWNFHYVSLTV
ncbi:MAG: hypothetical protein GY795_45810 [Desulfobacterales bacterium]|nr:hypothetical protein [Desulfobacterales bacterium]